jgi:predicted Zn-dependent protease
VGIDLPDDPLSLEIPGLGVEIPRLTDEDEIEIGREAAAEFESQNPISSDPALVERVSRIGLSIVPYQPRESLPYTFKVIDTTEINAFALPGGFIYVSQGMLDFTRTDDELSGVIGHEIAHVARRHSAQQIEAIVDGQLALETVLSGSTELETIYQDQSVQIATEMVGMIALRGWGRMNELDADEYGTVYMAHAGYDPQAVLDLMRRFMSHVTDDGGGGIEDLLATHPPFKDRIERVEYAILAHGLE